MKPTYPRTFKGCVIAMLVIGVGVPVLAKVGIAPDWFFKFVLFAYFPVGITLWITYYEGWWGGSDINSE